MEKKTMGNHSQEVIFDVVKMNANGLTYEQVSKEINKKYKIMTTRQSVAGIVYRAKGKLIEKPQKKNDLWTTENIERLVGLWNSGLAMSKIAELMGISHSTVRRQAAKMNLATRSKHKAAPVIVIDKAPDKNFIAPVKYEILKKFSNPAAKKKKFVDLKNRDCRFIVGDGKPEDFVFCAAPAIPGSAYCNVCHPLVFVKSIYAGG